MQHSTHGQSSQAVCAIVVACLLAGCSTYQVQKITSSDKTKVSPSGVPFTLVRPEYALSRVPPGEGEKKATYSMAVSYETDPTQTYTLRISPGAFANSDFIVKLNTTGALQSTTTTLTEQITPAITALGSFSKDLIGAMAAGAFDADSIRTAVKDAMKKQADCQGPSESPIAPIPDVTGKVLAVPTVAEAIASRMTTFKDDAEFSSLFHYVTEREKTCLQAAATALSALRDSQYKADTEAWSAKRKAYVPSQPGDGEFIAKVDKAVASDDTKLFASLKEANKALAADAATKQLAIDRDVILIAAQLASKAGKGSEAVTQLEFITNMDRPTWLARHLLYLERELSAVDLARLRRPALADDTPLSRYVESTRVQRARTLGAQALYERSLLLSKFLESIPQKTERGGSAPATAEYIAVRTELDTVLAQIDARRTRVLSDAKPPPPPPIPALKGVSVVRVGEQTIIDSTKAGWSTSEAGKSAAEYVLVLKEAP